MLQSALALDAPAIRVWAGNSGSLECPDRMNVVRDLVRICRMAETEHLTVTLECHPHTLTDSLEPSMRLFDEVSSNVPRVGWQPDFSIPHEKRLQWLEAVLPYLSTVHCHWHSDGMRVPLAQGAKEWREYLNRINGTGRDPFILPDFVADDSPGQFAADAETLKNWHRIQQGKIGELV